ncbi:MAG: isochorismatase family protein [Henriciella sp.]|nr:isochorismatase family protein [Henriciella sp.]
MLPPLIILDVQDAINQPVWDGKNNPNYLDAIERLLSAWRARGANVFHVKHNEANPNSSYHTRGPWNAIQARVAPRGDEPVIAKSQNCAFVDTGLHSVLQELGAEQIILTGVVIHNSMDATIRAGKALGYEILLPEDATTAVPVNDRNGKTWPAQDVFDLSLAVLGSEYAQVTSVDNVLKAFTG